MKNLERLLTKSIVIHPFLFAIFPIIFLLSYNIDTVSLDEIIWPSLIVILVTFLLWVLLSLIFKNRKKSGLVVSIGLILFFFYGHIYILFGQVEKEVSISHELLLPTFLVLFIIGTYFIAKSKKKFDNATTIVNVIAISLIGISSVNIATYYLDSSNYFEATNVEQELKSSTISNKNNYPDIYYIILDEYANTNNLKKYLNYDNQEFINFLTEKGFFVAPKSFSNYARSTVSIPSTLNMQYIHNGISDEGFEHLNLRAAFYLTENNKIMQHLKSKGYTTFSFNSGHGTTMNIKISDFNLCNDVNNLDSEFVPLLLRTTMLNPIHIQFFAGDYRDRILCIFNELSKMQERNEAPKFVFAHIMLPHQPYVFGANGEPVMPEAINKLNLFWDEERYLNQLKFANEKIKVVLDQLVKAENPPVVIILSDHGMRYGKNNWENPSKEFLDLRYANFKAYYFPNMGRNMLFEETTNVNSFRVLFNLYFNDDFDLLEDRILVSPDGVEKFSDWTDVTHILFEN